MGYFNNLLRQAIQVLNSTAYPADAIQYLSKASMGLKDTVSIIDEMRQFEDKLLQLTKNEKRLLKDEKNNA
jgi:predicted subunit of tRNA(5-methylaminomethyl-2-thiouridylate) methyltransferase